MSEEEEKANEEQGGNSRQRVRYQKEEEHEIGIWGILIFGLIGATATTLAVCWAYAPDASLVFFSGSIIIIISSPSFFGLLFFFLILPVSNQVTRSHTWKATNFQQESWKRYNRRMQEAYEEEMERVERIRRMQSVFNWEKSKQKRSYESWKENNNNASGYHQHFQREDWYWKTETSQGHRKEPPRNHSLSHHYAILGLSRSITKPYTDDEIKTAFRSKAKQFHPDQNQDNKEVAEARFKEVMTSYEAIKTERKNMK